MNRKTGTKLSIFWRYFAMMSCFILLMIAALLISSSRARKTITEEHLSVTELTLKASCTQLADTFFGISTVPVIVENSAAYAKIEFVSGTLPDKYVPTMREIRSTLLAQTSLLKGCEECMIAFPQFDKATSRRVTYAGLADYFQSVFLQETSAEDAIAMLETKGTFQILPMQNVDLHPEGASYTKRCLPIIVHPGSTKSGVLMLYTEKTILDMLGYSDLPEGSYLRIALSDGQVLAEYPETIPENTAQASYSLTANVDTPRLAVTVWIPKSYYNERMRPFTASFLLLIAVFSVVGLVLCILFSKRSSDPIREMIATYGGGQMLHGNAKGDNTESMREGETTQNELHRLDQILKRSKAERVQLRSILTQNYLTRVLTGGILTEEEETQFLSELPQSAPYVVLVIRNPEEVSQLTVYSVFEQSLTTTHVTSFLSNTEICVLFGEGTLKIEELETALRALSEAGILIHAGISEEIPDYQHLYSGVLQARAASFKAKDGMAVYEKTVSEREKNVWAKLEQLYQNIMAGREDVSLSILTDLARGCTDDSERTYFHAVLMTLSAASADLGLPMKELAYIQFDETALPGGNMERLRLLLIDLFLYSRAREKDGEEAQEENRIILYMRRHFGDPSICLAQLSERFSVSTRRINEIVSEYTGKTFNDYLLMLRMMRVKELLLDTELGVSEIAQMCGYPAESTFFRVFKQYYHMSPKRYREMQRMTGGDIE